MRGKTYTDTRLYPFIGEKLASLMDGQKGEVVNWMGFDGSTARGSLSWNKRHGNCRRLAACWNAFEGVPTDIIKAEGADIVQRGLDGESPAPEPEA